MNRNEFLSTFTVNEFINPMAFENLSDAVFDGNNIDGVIDKTKDIAIPIIFTPVNKIHLLDFPRQFIVVAGKSDGCILKDGETKKHCNNVKYNIYKNELPKNTIKIYSRCVDVEDETIIPIPIGLEDKKWYPHLDKYYWLEHLMKHPLEKTKLLYVNHNITTNLEERLLPYRLFKTNDWATIEKTKNGDLFEPFIKNISSHKFVLCPEGNGLGSHRMWEALYIGTIPIVKSRVCVEEFSKKLPILIVDDWLEITESFLTQKYFSLSSAEWDFNLLKMEYWRNLIWTGILIEPSKEVFEQ